MVLVRLKEDTGLVDGDYKAGRGSPEVFYSLSYPFPYIYHPWCLCFSQSRLHLLSCFSCDCPSLYRDYKRRGNYHFSSPPLHTVPVLLFDTNMPFLISVILVILFLQDFLRKRVYDYINVFILILSI